jgi:hypothetical protein
MRRNSKINYSEQRKKEIARRMYAVRQIDRFIKWTMDKRGYLKMKHLKEQYKKHNLPWHD